MAKIPYLFRRNNVFYFRIRVPVEHQKTLNTREIVQSLRTENQLEAIPQALKLAADFKAILQNLKTGKKQTLCHSELITSTNTNESIKIEPVTPSPTLLIKTLPIELSTKAQTPKLSNVVDDFLKRYDQENRAMLGKLNATLPILVELIGNKPINEIFQTDVNEFFDEVQKLPVRRDAKAFQGLPIRKVIEANTGPCIAEKTFISTYRACIGVFLQWAINNYKDRGFPALNTSGAIYRGERADGINKQRAMKPEELQKLFNNLKMKKYKANPETVHYFWLPLIGLYTGARINEVCQLNPFEDIKQDLVTGIHYFHFTDESESVESIAAKDTGYNVYGQENTISGDLSAGNRWLSESRFTSLYKYHLHEGDLVLTRKGSLGNSRLIKTLPQPGIIDSDTIRLRVSDTLIQSDFLSLLLHEAQYVSEQIMLSKRGAILGGINTETISNIVIVLPQRSEQDALMKELNTQVQQLDSGIHESGHVINLLKERRTTLISAAVTGKIDVRGLISKAIPEEAAA